jgi:hypothetical protein
VQGRLVGSFARDAAGVLTHHGSWVHVHAIVDLDPIFTGHVESTGIAAGAVLRVPEPSGDRVVR